MINNKRSAPLPLQIMACILALLSFGVIIHASYPGYLNPDALWQLSQVLEGHYADWHSPFMALVWSLTHALLPGPAGFIVFDNVLIWGGLTLVAIGAMRTVGAWAVLVLLLPWLPGLFNFLGHVHKDAMLVACLLAAFASAFRANDPAAGPRARGAWQALANLLALAAFLTRESVIFGLIPLLLYANLRFGWRRSLFAALLALCLMPGIQSVQNRLLEVEAHHPADSIKTYHLLALSYFEGRNLFPGQWTAAESRAIVDSCYSPVQWDTVAGWGQCAPLVQGLQRQGLWGSAQLTRAWLQALAANPLGAYSAMAATFERSMHDPNSRAMLFEQPSSASIQFDFSSPLRATTELARGYIESDLNDSLGRPYVFAIVFVVSAVLIFILRLGATRFGLFALALTASGTIYLLTYFPLNVSAEYRYFYWCGFAAYLGLSFTFLAWIARRRGRELDAPDAPQPMPALMRLALCAVLALMIALVFGAARLPLESRSVQLTPLGDGAIAVTQLSTASIPLWMGVRHEGRIEAPGWHYQHGPALRSESGAGPLVAHIETLHHVIRLRLASGPDGGSVRVEDGDFSQVIDTRAAAVGEIVIDLPPNGKLAERPRHASWHAPARALLWTLVLTALLFRLGGARPRRNVLVGHRVSEA